MTHTPVPLSYTKCRSVRKTWYIYDANDQHIITVHTKELAKQIVTACNEYEWMRREIERAGDALFTTTSGKYTGTEEDLHAIGQTVEGVCDTNDELRRKNEELIETLEIAMGYVEFVEQAPDSDPEDTEALELCRKTLAKAREGK